MPRKPSKPRVPRTRNAGTMTEAQFKAWVIRQLRFKVLRKIEHYARIIRERLEGRK